MLLLLPRCTQFIQCSGSSSGTLTGFLSSLLLCMSSHISRTVAQPGNKCESAQFLRRHGSTRVDNMVVAATLQASCGVVADMNMRYDARMGHDKGKDSPESYSKCTCTVTAVGTRMTMNATVMSDVIEAQNGGQSSRAFIFYFILFFLWLKSLGTDNRHIQC